MQVPAVAVEAEMGGEVAVAAAAAAVELTMVSVEEATPSTLQPHILHNTNDKSTSSAVVNANRSNFTSTDSNSSIRTRPSSRN